MKYTVGAYSFDVPNPFKSNDEAVKYIQARHPELSREEIATHLKPAVENEFNQSDRIVEEGSESQKTDTKTGEGGSDRKQDGKNKPG